MQRKFIVTLFILLLFLVFALKNNQIIQLDLYFWKVDFNLSFLVIIALTIGAVISFVLSLPGAISKRKEVNTLKKKISSLEREMMGYKSKKDARQASPTDTQGEYKEGENFISAEQVEKKQESGRNENPLL